MTEFIQRTSEMWTYSLFHYSEKRMKIKGKVVLLIQYTFTVFSGRTKLMVLRVSTFTVTQDLITLSTPMIFLLLACTEAHLSDLHNS